VARLRLGNLLNARGDLAGAEAAFRQAIRLDPGFAFAHNNLGFLLRARGDLAGAEAAFRQALRLDPGYAPAHNHLGLVLQQKGDMDGAVAAYKRALQIEPKNTFALTLLPEAEQGSRLLRRLPAVLAGKDQPKTPAEACELAFLCAQPFHQRFAAAARLYEGAFAADAKLVDDLAAAHRYNAACCAARAARGDGAGAPANPARRAALRGKALAWLRADLARFEEQAASAEVPRRRTAADTLTHWLADTDLSGLREPKALESLPADERQQWRKLWAGVRAALAEARKQPSPPERLPPPQVEPR
jgi:tetratricopeptide (TPR) repeat protein